jgi:hypothetical protein
MKRKIIFVSIAGLVTAGIVYLVRLPQADTYTVKRKEKLENRRGNLQGRDRWDQ